MVRTHHDDPNKRNEIILSPDVRITVFPSLSVKEDKSFVLDNIWDIAMRKHSSRLNLFV